MTKTWQFKAYLKKKSFFVSVIRTYAGFKKFFKKKI